MAMVFLGFVVAEPFPSPWGEGHTSSLRVGGVRHILCPEGERLLLFYRNSLRRGPGTVPVSGLSPSCSCFGGTAMDGDGTLSLSGCSH